MALDESMHNTNIRFLHHPLKIQINHPSHPQEVAEVEVEEEEVEEVEVEEAALINMMQLINLPHMIILKITNKNTNNHLNNMVKITHNLHI